MLNISAIEAHVLTRIQSGIEETILKYPPGCSDIVSGKNSQNLHLQRAKAGKYHGGSVVQLTSGDAFPNGIEPIALDLDNTGNIPNVVSGVNSTLSVLT